MHPALDKKQDRRKISTNIILLCRFLSIKINCINIQGGNVEFNGKNGMWDQYVPVETCYTVLA
jgi:hypothetical protein